MYSLFLQGTSQQWAVMACGSKGVGAVMPRHGDWQLDAAGIGGV